MAIFDFILPDLAPEQYSSGEGTGYAKVMPSNAPDIFSQTQDLIDAELEAKKRNHEKDILNEKNRQAKLDEYVANIQYDPKWEYARSNFDQEVNGIGDFISEWRASGKPVNDKFNLELNKRKAKLNSLKGMNDKAFEAYNRNMQTMLAGLGKDYEKEDIENYEAAITKAYEEGGVQKGFEATTTTRPLKQFDLMSHLKKNGVVPENETGELLQTKPEELDVKAKFSWDELTKERKLDVMEDLYLEGNIKEKTPEAAIQYFRDQLELWDKEQRARPRAPRSSGGGGRKTTTPVFGANYIPDESIADATENNLKKEDLSSISLYSAGNSPVVMPLKTYASDTKPSETKTSIVIDVKPYWTEDGERKFKINAIPMDLIEVSGSGLKDKSSVTADIIERYRDQAIDFPLSEYYNAEDLEEKFPGISKVITKQIERDRSRGNKVTWERGKFY
jgi:hypothetical protein